MASPIDRGSGADSSSDDYRREDEPARAGEVDGRKVSGSAEGSSKEAAAKAHRASKRGLRGSPRSGRPSPRRALRGFDESGASSPASFSPTLRASSVRSSPSGGGGPSPLSYESEMPLGSRVDSMEPKAKAKFESLTDPEISLRQVKGLVDKLGTGELAPLAFLSGVPVENLKGMVTRELVQSIQKDMEELLPEDASGIKSLHVQYLFLSLPFREAWTVAA